MKRRILLVDDELAILLTLRAVLEMNGFEVDTAASSREAEQKLNNGVYEMVISDMRMETETSGYDVIRAAREQAYDPATAILTAYPILSERWQSEGVQSLLVKPVNTPDLIRQLEALLITHQDEKVKNQKLKLAATGKKVAMPNTVKPSASAADKKAL